MTLRSMGRDALAKHLSSAFCIWDLVMLMRMSQSRSETSGLSIVVVGMTRSTLGPCRLK